ncbi:MAG: TonB family protein [Bacteroidota bacterium]
MKPLSVIVVCTLLAACSSTEELSDITLPELIVQYPLPAFPTPIASTQLRIEFKLLVTEDGSVKFVELLSGSGNREWDATAIAAIKQWRYTPALYKNKPMKLWLKQAAIVQFSEPQYLSLQEIVMATKDEADSVFALLEHGYKFEEMVALHSTSPSRTQYGMLGTVNIQVYPYHIRQAVAKLEENQYTTPLKFGDRYVIFRRVQSKQTEVLP